MITATAILLMIGAILVLHFSGFLLAQDDVEYKDVAKFVGLGGLALIVASILWRLT